MRTTIVHNAVKLDADGVADDFWLAFADSKIIATGQGDDWQRFLVAAGQEAEVIDALGRLLTPGFLDLHVHGGGGAGYEQGREAILAGVSAHARYGTTRSLVGLATAALDELEQNLDIVAALARHTPAVMGAYLEGPFLSPRRKGAHDAKLLRAPDPGAVDRLLDAGGGHLRQITIAPELPGALEAVDTFVAAGVVVAVGHTEADYELARKTFDRGARSLTHAFNAMYGIHHRAPGPVLAAVDDDRVMLELVLDGVHVSPPVARLLMAVAPERIAFVTDAMAAAGAGDGSYRLGSLQVTVRDGRAVLSGSDTLAGSTLTQNAALRIAVSCGFSDVAAVTALTATPARLLGVDDRLGYLRDGYTADLALLDRSWNVHGVWREGISLTPLGSESAT